MHGYQFNRGDQAEHLPQVYRLLQPGLYPHDFFLTLYDQTFTVREYWVWLVYAFSKMIGVEAACFLLHVGCCTLTAYVWMHLSAMFTGSKWSGLVAVPLMLTVLNSFTVGGNQLLGAAFIGSIPAEALAYTGLLFYLRGKHYQAMILLGLATWFQALVGLQACVLLCMLHGLYGFTWRKIGEVSLLFLLYLLSAAPMLFPVLMKQFNAPVPTDQAAYYRLLYMHRNILHYIPSLFPATDYLKLGGLLLVTIATLVWKKQTIDKRLWYLVAFILLGCLLYHILLDHVQWMSIGKLQWFKTTVLLNALCCVVIAGVIRPVLEKFQVIFQSKTMIGFTTTGSLVGLLMITNAAYLPSAKLANRYQVGYYAYTDLQQMHFWMNEHLPIDAMVLAPPDDDAFACEAKRSMPANYKAVVHEPFYFMAWQQSMTDYYGVDFTSLQNESALPQAVINYQQAIHYPQPNKAQYRLDDTTTCKFLNQLGPTNHQQGKWRLSVVK